MRAHPTSTQTDKFSRLIFHDLAPELARLRGAGTAFVPHSLRIGLGAGDYSTYTPRGRWPGGGPRSDHPRFDSRSQSSATKPTWNVCLDKFQRKHTTACTKLCAERIVQFDSLGLSAVHFTNKSCPISRSQFEDSFTDTNFSRSEVNFNVNEDKPECALPIPGHAFTYLNLNEQCAESVVPGENVVGLPFEPRCMVVVIAPDSRRDLLDQLLAAGRPLADPMYAPRSPSPHTHTYLTSCCGQN